jgi:hypothetical protein
MNGTRLLWSLVALLALLTVAQAAGLVKNAEFVTRAAGNEDWPADWTAAPEAMPLYQAVNDDGCADKDSLHYQAKAGQKLGPVAQPVVLAPNTDYVLMAAFKSDGTVKPVARLMGPDGQLAIVVSDGTKTWTSFAARFNSGAAKGGVVEIWGDAAAVKSKDAQAGTAAIDGVNVYLPAEVPTAVAMAAAFVPPGPNVALGKPYTLLPAPNYGYATDRGDKTQLTDGAYTVGYFWTQKTTVGWQNAAPAIVSLDLGQVQPLAGLSYNTAAGVAGVTWPTSIIVMVSDDGKTWGMAGDLIEMATRNGGPPAEPYSIHRFATGDLKTHGRYVKLYIDQVPYTFVDEIEVYQGPDALLQIAYTNTEANPEVLFAQRRVHTAVLWRLRTDLAEARRAIEASGLKAEEKQALLAKAAAIAPEIEKLPLEIPAGFRSVLPLNAIHARIYALHAPLHRAQGLGPLTVWHSNRWDPLQPVAVPAGKPASPQLRVQMMRREYRGEAFNLTNATDNVMTLDLAISGLPGGPNPDYVSVREVPFTDTRDRIPIAAALPEAQKAGNAYRLTIPAGMTRQVWLDFRPMDVKAGRYTGQINLTGAARASLPLMLQLYPLDFPAMPGIHIGGWDYTNGPRMYDATPENQQALIRTMIANYVDTPWATSSVQPANAKFDPEGNLTSELKFDNWDEWTAKWPGARLYAVFLSVGNGFAGEPMGSPRFQRMVAEWITGWVKHLGDQNLQPEQLVLLLYDEPSQPEGYEIIKTWALAINAAQPRVTLFEDPTSRDPAEVDPTVWPELDIICPNLPMFLGAPPSFRDFFAALKQSGKTLWFYSCSGPSKLLDPVTYHRSQFWWNVKYGGEGSFYWAFGDEGGGDSWNAYMQTRAQYSPLFLSPDSVTDAKHMAGIREGAQDYEYFMMLRARLAELERKGVKSPLLDRARRLAVAGPDRVVAGITRDNLAWSVPKDRGVMDEVRVQVLDLLEKLAKL